MIQLQHHTVLLDEYLYFNAHPSDDDILKKIIINK